ncbi:hypothetical protein WA026_005241 [Henosepilachna vigintioctopunctata]|uniref:Reverse transcriptase n=1 Tax=Henosepilachna vigintioctopunctata TaxID=420089 RepID=A0AAW1UTY5_9CUCU
MIAALNYDLCNLQICSENHCLKLNSAKTDAILFGKPTERKYFLQQYLNNIVLDGSAVKFNDKVRSLGVWIDQDLRFTDHISMCLQRAYASLKLLYHNAFSEGPISHLVHSVREQTFVAYLISYAAKIGPAKDIKSGAASRHSICCTYLVLPVFFLLNMCLK